MKKLFVLLMAAVFLLGAAPVTQAAGLNELTETKVQLEDNLTVDDFAAAYMYSELLQQQHS